MPPAASLTRHRKMIGTSPATRSTANGHRSLPEKISAPKGKGQTAPAGPLTPTHPGLGYTGFTNPTLGSGTRLHPQVPDTAMPAQPRPCEPCKLVQRNVAVQMDILPVGSGRQTSCTVCQEKTGYVARLLGTHCCSRGVCPAGKLLIYEGMRHV